jgi:citrate lyase synthetase
MEFEIEAAEASDINVDEIVARLQTQRRNLTASAVGNVVANKQYDLVVVKVPSPLG